jgi:hypothetical protein
VGSPAPPPRPAFPALPSLLLPCPAPLAPTPRLWMQGAGAVTRGEGAAAYIRVELELSMVFTA